MAEGMSIGEWQRRFREEPRMWVTYYIEDGVDEISNVYESEVAAREEIEWAKRYGKRLPRIRSYNIHSFELSRARWSDPTPPPRAPEAPRP